MTGKKERQRKLARERYERQQARRAQRARRWRVTGAVAAAVLVLGGAGTAAALTLGGGGKTAAAAGSPSATPSASPSVTPSPGSSATPAAVTEPARHCTYTPKPPASRNVGLPPAKPDYKARYQAAIHTNRGTIRIDLLNSKATCTVNSFVYLAAKSYFNNTHCHRLTTSSGVYVLQCGDPTGTGTGGPGYEFADENLAGAKYPQGTVAMANAGPGTNGSQFFLVYKNTAEPPSYTPFGTIVGGLGVIRSVARAGTANGSGDGPPKQSVVIKRVTISKT